MSNPLIAQPPIVFPDFGRWLSFREAVKSQTAISRGIANNPTLVQYQNMVQVYQRVYAPLCQYYELKLPVSSFFRSIALNKAIGGSATSAHCDGLAIDIDCDGLLGGPTNKELFRYVSEKMSFDQCILESPDQNGNPQWVHVGIKLVGNRQEKLVMHRVNGKSTYERLA